MTVEVDVAFGLMYLVEGTLRKISDAAIVLKAGRNELIPHPGLNP
jgi:hypothetical protein